MGEQFSLASLNTEDGAYLDFSANGLWGGQCEKTYIDVEVFNPHAPSNKFTNVFTENIKHELSKKCSYEARILEIEHSSFTPLIFQPQVEWLMKPPFFFTSIWLSYFRPNGTHPVQLLWDGFGAAFLSPSEISYQMFTWVKVL